MASSFDALPPEMVQKCVEFLDFDLVSGDLRGLGLGLGRPPLLQFRPRLLDRPTTVVA